MWVQLTSMNVVHLYPKKKGGVPWQGGPPWPARVHRRHGDLARKPSAARARGNLNLQAGEKYITRPPFVGSQHH